MSEKTLVWLTSVSWFLWLTATLISYWITFALIGIWVFLICKYPPRVTRRFYWAGRRR